MQDKMSFILTYELKQETPIIHFQHNQSGATLRATEVKPKLDKFIIKKLGGAEKINKDWFVKDTEALNYKMQISATCEPNRSNTIDKAIKIKELDSQRLSARVPKGNEQKTLEQELKKEINEMYFGNMVSGKTENYAAEVREKYKETLFFVKPLKLKIICAIKELRATIDSCLEEFFLVHNFGTRQSKGFGGFTVVKSEKQIDPIKILKENGYNFFYARVPDSRPEYRKMLNHAKNIYTIIKGGYNHTRWDEKNTSYKFPKRYIKGYIHRQFMNDFNLNSVGSDKAFIKSKKEPKHDCRNNYPANRYGKQQEYKYNEYLFVRALLGLADHYEFRDDVRSGDVGIFCLGEESFDVERFKSPITIKIVNNFLIFIVGSFDEICGKKFYFSPNGYSKNLFEDKNYSQIKKIIETNKNYFVEIETPEKFDDDDTKKFIENFIAYFEKEKKKLENFIPDISCTKDIKLESGV